ncbi:MAG: C-GCAxxG-C-C family protein, partial [Promethearchaeota archaeon]
EKECTGCAQTVVAAMFEALGIWNDDVFKAASGLANGLGLTGDGSCAALLGASMVISYLFGREHKDFNEIYKPMKSYGLVKKLHNKFLRQYGSETNSCRCSDVQRGLIGVSWDLWSLNEMDDSFKTQMIDCCSKLVGNIAKLATEIILENGYTPEF